MFTGSAIDSGTTQDHWCHVLLVQVAAQVTRSEVEAAAPSGTRVIDQIGEVHTAQGKQDRAPGKEPSLKAANMPGSFMPQWRGKTLDLLGPAATQQSMIDSNSGYHGSEVQLPQYQAPEYGASTPLGTAPTTPTSFPKVCLGEFLHH